MASTFAARNAAGHGLIGSFAGDEFSFGLQVHDLRHYEVQTFAIDSVPQHYVHARGEHCRRSIVGAALSLQGMND